MVYMNKLQLDPRHPKQIRKASRNIVYNDASLVIFKHIALMWNVTYPHIIKYMIEVWKLSSINTSSTEKKLSNLIFVPQVKWKLSIIPFSCLLPMKDTYFFDVFQLLLTLYVRNILTEFITNICVYIQAHREMLSHFIIESGRIYHPPHPPTPLLGLGYWCQGMFNWNKNSSWFSNMCKTSLSCILKTAI